MPMITVIVPVYNAVRTLDPCVHSLLEQTLSDFELLLINDGSTDESAQLCNAWRARDSRIRAFHQNNAGVQSAVLLGISQARAPYCAFVDSDDTVKHGFLTALWQGVKETDADIVCCGFADVEETGAQKTAWVRTEKQCFEQPQIAQALNSFFEREADLTSFCAAPRWNKLYRTELLRAVAPSLEPSQAFGEDTQMNLYALVGCKRLAVVPYVGYCYTVQSTSATRSMSEKKCCQYFQMMQLLQKAAKDLGQDGAALQARQDSLFSALILQALLSPLNHKTMWRIVRTLRSGIKNKSTLRRFAKTQPWHGRLALACIAAGGVLPATGLVRLFRLVAELSKKQCVDAAAKK